MRARFFYISFLLLVLTYSIIPAWAAEESIDPEAVSSGAIFDDKMLFNGYVNKYKDEPKEVLLAMMNDTTLGQYKVAAAVRVFKHQFADEMVATEKNVVEKVFIRLLSHEDSPFIQVEIMHTLIVLDRYRYFKIMIPRLIEKIDHYNDAISDMAYDNLTEVVTQSKTKTREARIIFNTLRKVLFLSRKKLELVREPDERLQRKLDLLFWSVKVLGTQELKDLPSEVIRLM